MFGNYHGIRGDEICLAAVFLTFGLGAVRTEGDEGVLELFGTGWEDVEVVGDGFVPLAREEMLGVRLKARSRGRSCYLAWSKEMKQKGQGSNESSFRQALLLVPDAT